MDSINNHFLTADSMLDSMLGTRNTTMKKAQHSPSQNAAFCSMYR